MAPRMHGDGGNTQRNQPHRLMAWGVSASALPQPNLAGERRRVNTQNSQGNSGKYIFLFFCRRLPTIPLEEDSGLEGRVMHFLALEVTIWAPRVWNEGIFEVVVGPRSAYSYKYWHQADAQVQPAFDGLVSCRRALETVGGPADRFIDLFRAPLQTFQLQMITTESSVPISELRARLRTQQQRSLRCRF
ncbi:putative trans-sialidase [Trypanosoma cruzi]|nr:putative trans-sialidase [Trypanosoma cruzi]